MRASDDAFISFCSTALMIIMFSLVLASAGVGDTVIRYTLPVFGVICYCALYSFLRGVFLKFIVRFFYFIIIASLFAITLAPAAYNYVTMPDRDLALFMLIGEVILFVIVFVMIWKWND